MAEYEGVSYRIDRPCPFCGSSELEILWNHMAHVDCCKCGMRGPYGEDPMGAVIAWDMRVRA